MGTCYYLIRRDNRSGYDLGKSYGWDKALGNGNSFIADNPKELAESLKNASEGWNVSEDYFQKVADDIIDWAEGKPFEYHSEQSGFVEDLFMEDYPAEKEWITGDRHIPGMDELYKKRHRL